MSKKARRHIKNKGEGKNGESDLVWDEPELAAMSPRRPGPSWRSSAFEKFRFSHKRLLPTRRDCRRRSYGESILDPLEIIARSRNIHKILFAFMYGKQLDLAAKSMTPHLAIYMADLLAYADYYGLMGMAGKRVEKWLLSLSNIWEDVRAEPKFWVAMGRAILSKPIFHDAIKHMVGKGGWALEQDRWSRIGHGASLKDDVYPVAMICEMELRKEVRRLWNDLADVLTFSKHAPSYRRYQGVLSENSLANLRTTKAGQAVRNVASSWLMRYALSDTSFNELAYEKQRGSLPWPDYWTKCRSYRFLYQQALTKNFSALAQAPVVTLADSHGLRLAEVQACINDVCAELVECFEKSPLFDGLGLCQNDRNDYTQKPLHKTTCKDYRAKCESKHWFTYMSPGDQHLRPEIWDRERPEFPFVCTRPASEELLKAIGVDFSHLVPSGALNEIRHLKPDIFD
jgi:hypothetical protein